MFLRWVYRGLIAGLLFAIAMDAPATRAVAQVSPPNLFTAGNTLTTSSHYVSTSLFTWDTSTGGQFDGPWVPLEGRAAWDGSPAYFEAQIKQMMSANIDVISVETYNTNPPNVNFFRALSNLRAQGYNVPKVAPFLDTSLSYVSGWPSQSPDTTCDLATTAGKDSFVTMYSNFYQAYYNVNTDAYADSYIAQLSGRVLMNCYQLMSAAPSAYVANSSSLTRADVQSRLTSALGAQHPLFNSLPATGTFMIDCVNGDHLSFEDERLSQFEGPQYYWVDSSSKGRRAASLKPGYWDQNVRNPGNFVPRDGGSYFTSAWNSAVNARTTVKHAYVESWNEYDEGSGIYAANPGPPYIKPGSGNTNTDTWSSTNDPYQYIKTTAAGARQFNDIPDLGSTILWNNLPTAMGPGQTLTVQVIVRNDGDLSWTGAAGFKLGELNDPTMFGPGPYLIDDTTNEIPTYGGIFRGRPITFNVQLTAPTTYGTYTTHWQMEENGAWFGQEVTAHIPVALNGDANLDGRVDVSDLAILAANYRKHVTGGWAQADLNDDGVVDVEDLALLAANYRQTIGGPSLSQAEATFGLPQTVPEPSGCVLLATGMSALLVGLWTWGRRKRN